MFNIMVVEDDRKLAALMCAVLKKNGYTPISVSDGEAAIELLSHEHVDLIISDIMMPNMAGYELTRQLRDSGYSLPILMVTARSTFEDKQQGFVAGADDYMVKPIDLGEMILRVGALLRRSQIATAHKLTVGGTVLDYDSLAVFCGGETHQLPKKEFFLLFKLLSYPGQIFTRAQLMDEIWGMESEADERTVDVHIKRLRERFYDSPDFEIITVRGLGYKAVKKA